MSGSQIIGSVGTYTPTLTNVANIDSTSALKAIFYRFGNMCFVWGQLNIDPTTGSGTTTQVGISLPIASNLAALDDLSGVANWVAATTTLNGGGVILGDAANDRATLQFACQNTGSELWAYSFAYIIQ